jgi:electron transfer flavoprotein beta subunit
MRIVLLASIGFHPVSKRPRIVPDEARGLALAASIAGAEIVALHAGPADRAEPVLRPLLGMGATRLRLLDCAGDADIVAPLLAELAALAPDIIVAGTVAEAGEGSGMVPFVVAERLARPIVAGATALTISAGGAELVTAEIVTSEPGGRRRGLASPLPLVLTVDAKGPPARLAAIGPARRGLVERLTAEAERDAAADWSRRPARARPKRLAGPKADGEQLASGRQVLADATPEAAAEAILAFLRRQGFVPAASTSSRE